MTPNNASAAAIEFALTADEGMSFLRCWNEGDFEACRKEWPEAPEVCYVGADPQHPDTLLASTTVPSSDAMVHAAYRITGAAQGLPKAVAFNEGARWMRSVLVPETPAFQHRVYPWMLECFGVKIAADGKERNHRFFEEATELVQSKGLTRSEAHQLVDYVFNRPIGEPQQEVGGVMVTLAAWCLAHGLDMHEAGEIELARISVPEMVAKIRAKQASKPKHSPLPEPVAYLPMATLHDDGYYTFKAGQEPHGARYAGWRMDVFAAPQTPPVLPEAQDPRVAFIRGWDERGMAQGVGSNVETNQALRDLVDVYYPKPE